MSGPADRWARLEALFDGALERPVAERRAWLEQASGGDRLLRDEVLAMLAAHDAEGPLDRPITPPESQVIPGDVAAALAGRYQLDEPLGEGGMARVFLAHEQKHDRKVVIKILKPHIAAWFGADRFRTEVELVARLAHPHILGLIDSGEAGGFLYYVMPYVGGETLHTRLARQGRLDPADALPLLRDLADALEYAHGAGVVHRDLKPENVLCVGGHAFLMDFGIARLMSSVAGRTTAAGVVLGTPGYMAPEQQSGGTIDHRADLWAWGVVAREALLGTRDPTIRLESRPDLPADLVSLVNRCLQVDANDRPASAAELVARLEALQGGPGSGAQPVIRPPARRWPWVAGGAALLAATALLVFRPERLDPEGLAMPVAVAPLRNETGDSTLMILGRLAGDWITQGLQQTGRVTVVSWPAAVNAAERHEGSAGDVVRLLRDETRAGTVVTGAYYLVDGTLRFQAEIIDARTGTLLAAPVPVEVPRGEAQEGVRQLRDRVMGMLAAQTDERLRDLPGVLERPPTWEAYRAFDRGLRIYNAQQYGEAALAMREAHALDTMFLEPLAYAAMAHWNRGERERTDSLVRHLSARRPMLSEYLELSVEYLTGLLAGEGERALRALRRADSLAPGSRAAYNAARLALTLNRPAEARALLESVDPDRGLMRGWQSYWTQYTHALHLGGDYQAELEATRRMRERHPTSRVATVLQARALASLGRTAALDSLLADLEPLPADVYWSQGGAMVTAAEEMAAHGVPGSEVYHERAIRWLANHLARSPTEEGHRYWLASALYDARQWRDARPYFESLAREFPGRFDYRSLAALVDARLGDVPGALARLGDPPRYDRGDHTFYRALITAIGGDTEDAVSLLAEALNRGVGGWSYRHADARHEFALMAGDPRLARLLKGDLP